MKRSGLNGLLHRFITEDAGQDLVEYALLAAFIGVMGWLSLRAIEGSVLEAYLSWLDPTTGTPGAWEPANP